VHSRRAPVVLTLLVVAALASCSSASKSTTSAPSTTAQASPPTVPAGPLDEVFKAKADIACRAVGAELRAQGAFPFPDFDPDHPDRSRFAQIAAYEAQTVAAEQDWQLRMHAIGTPTTGGAAWAALLRVVDRAVTLTAAQQQAAAHGDATAFSKSFHDLTNASTDGTQTALAAGLPTCDPSNLGA
jgi:hypothetical protein